MSKIYIASSGSDKYMVFEDLSMMKMPHGEPPFVVGKYIITERWDALKIEREISLEQKEEHVPPRKTKHTPASSTQKSITLPLAGDENIEVTTKELGELLGTKRGVAARIAKLYFEHKKVGGKLKIKSRSKFPFTDLKELDSELSGRLGQRFRNYARLEHAAIHRQPDAYLRSIALSDTRCELVLLVSEMATIINRGGLFKSAEIKNSIPVRDCDNNIVYKERCETTAQLITPMISDISMFFQEVRPSEQATILDKEGDRLYSAPFYNLDAFKLIVRGLLTSGYITPTRHFLGLS